MLDLVSGGRVEFGTGRSSTRAEIEGFGINPLETREMWDEALRPHRRLLDQRRVRVRGQALADAAPARAPQAVAGSAPADLGRDVERRGALRDRPRGIGLLSFTVGNPPEQLEERIQNYRRGQADCTQPVGKFRNDTAATFTMVHCNDTNEKARSRRRRVVRVVSEDRGAEHRVARRVDERGQAGARQLRLRGRGAARARSRGMFDFLNMDYLYDSGAGVVGDPDRCIEICKRYEAVGCELLFCLLNPYNIPHEEVMHSIELLGQARDPRVRRLTTASAAPGRRAGRRSTTWCR